MTRYVNIFWRNPPKSGKIVARAESATRRPMTPCPRKKALIVWRRKHGVLRFSKKAFNSRASKKRFSERDFNSPATGVREIRVVGVCVVGDGGAADIARVRMHDLAPTPPWHARADSAPAGPGLCLFKLCRGKLTSPCSTGLDVRFWTRESWQSWRFFGVGRVALSRPKSAHGGGGACAAVAAVDGARMTRARAAPTTRDGKP